ncbi:MAG: endolytic transglycosylase MltG, partial [FCB group bacterium]|nr:endolytic transglycosylase MltG [FCB group bacterium]
AVYHNRLRKGMRLQADPTIQYIIPDSPRRLRLSDLWIDSPYNTYRINGLPPGPINNPGLRALKAALHPADAPYLYFVAKGDGYHSFNVTLAEHNDDKRKYARARRMRFND